MSGYVDPYDPRRQQDDGLMDPWAGIAPEPEILTDEIEVTPRTPEQVNAGMAELLRRIRERDEPQQAARDYAAELAGGAGVRQALAPAMAPTAPQVPAMPPVSQSPPLPPPVPQGAPLASTTPPMGAPPMAPPVAAAPPAVAPPALTTPQGVIPPAAPPQDGTAGAEAAALAAPRPGGVQPPPQARPADTMSKGTPGMGGTPGGIQSRQGSGPGLVAEGPTFDQRVADAQQVDDRRERLRRILKGVGALLAAATGNVGLMLPGVVGASLVPESDEEETLRAGDTREQAIGTEQARRQAILDQLAQRREAQAADERQAQQTLALRARELDGDEADRNIRTGLEVARTDPTSGRSEQMREALVRFARTLPPEVQASVLSGDLSGLSAEESERLILSLSGVESGRQRGGGAASGGGGLATGQRLSGVNEAPEAFVLGVREGSPSMTPEEARQSANIRWEQMKPRDRADWESSPDGVRARTALAQRIPGYEQETTGTLSPEQHSQARAAAANQAAFDVAMDRALGAAEEIEGMSAGDQVANRAGDLVGYESSDALAAYNDARGAIIAQLNRLAEAGVMNESEFARWEQQLPRISDFRSLGDSTRRLRQVRERVREMTDARLAASGYRRTQEERPASSGSASGFVRVRLPDGTERAIPVTERASREAIEAAIRRREGWEVL